MQVFVYIVLLQYPLQVGETIEYLTRNLCAGEDALIPIVLQGARKEKKPLADLSPCKVEFALKEWTVCLCCCSHTLCEVSDTQDEFLHLGCFSADGFVFHSSFYF